MYDTSVYVQIVLCVQSRGKISFTNSQRWEMMKMLLAQIPFDISSCQALTVTYFLYMFIHIFIMKGDSSVA